MTERIYPGELANALQDVNIPPGDRLLVKARSRAGSFNCLLKGTAEKPIVVKPYSGLPRMDGYIVFRGEWVELHGMEITDADFTERSTDNYGPLPAGIPQVAAAVANVPNVRLVNCVIHDCRQGPLGAFSELNGCIIYHNGWHYTKAANTWGHGVYSSNPTTRTITVRNCILFGGFGYGIHIYSEYEPLNNYVVEDNIVFDSGMLRSIPQSNILVGGAGAGVANKPILRRNCTYFSGSSTPNKLGFQAGAVDAIVEDNYMPEGMNSVKVTGTETGNYYGPAIGNRVFLRGSHLAIYNEAGTESINVDVGSIYKAGDIVALRNVQDYFKDITLAQVAEDGTLKVDMLNHTVAAPQGWNAPASTFPKFGCFVLENI